MKGTGKMIYLFLIWALCGIVGHIRQANEMKTYFGKPIWEDFGTYIMFIPAMVAGPLILFYFKCYDDRHPERKQPE